MKEAVLSFTGSYSWLSNFYPAEVLFEGHFYPTVEHAYQAAKTHPSQRAPFRKPSLTPSQAKKLGRTVSVRSDWDTVKQGVMLTLLREKFSPYSYLANKLLETGDAELIEGNYWGDQYWGICRGKGHNYLGKLLMQVRSELERIKE